MSLLHRAIQLGSAREGSSDKPIKPLNEVATEIFEVIMSKKETLQQSDISKNDDYDKQQLFK